MEYDSGKWEALDKGGYFNEVYADDGCIVDPAGNVHGRGNVALIEYAPLMYQLLKDIQSGATCEITGLLNDIEQRWKIKFTNEDMGLSVIVKPEFTIRMECKNGKQTEEIELSNMQ